LVDLSAVRQVALLAFNALLGEYIKTLSVSERIKKLTEANVVKEQLVSFVNDSWEGQPETEEEIRSWVGDQFDKWVTDPAAFVISWGTMETEESVKEQVTLPEAESKLPINLPDSSFKEPSAEGLDDMANAVKLDVSLPENEEVSENERLLYVTEEMVKEFTDEARKLITSPWMKGQEEALIVTATSEYSASRDAGSVLQWFRDYLQRVEETGIKDGEIDPQTLAKVEEEAKPTFKDLLTDPWMESGAFYNTLRNMYDYYVGEYGHEKGVDEFLDYAQSIRATGMEEGLIDKEGRYIGAAYLRAGLTEGELAQVLNAMLADVAEIPVAEEVEGDFNSYMNAIVEHVSNLAGEDYGMQDITEYAKSLIADLASNAMLAAMGMGAVVVPEEFPSIDDFLAEVAVEIEKGDVGIEVADVPPELHGYGKKDIAVLTDDKVMQLANTLEESIKQGGQVDFDEFSANEVREYLQSKVPEEGYTPPTMMDIIENQDAWTLEELQALMQQAVDQAKQAGQQINLNPQDFKTKAEVLIALRNLLAETKTESGQEGMGIRERQQQAYMQVRGIDDSERAAKFRSSPARLWEEFDRQADEILDRAGIRFDSKRERLKERAIGRVVDPSDIDLTQQIHQIPYITESRLRFMLGKLRSYVGEDRAGISLVNRALENSDVDGMPETIQMQIRQRIEEVVEQLGVTEALAWLEDEIARYRQEAEKMNEISDAAYKVFGKRKLGAAESFTPGGEGGASGTWRDSDIAQDIYNLGHEWEKLGGGSSNEVYDFVNKLWVPGIGFKEEPLLAIRMWMYDQWEREDRRLESVIISIQWV